MVVEVEVVEVVLHFLLIMVVTVVVEVELWKKQARFLFRS